MATATTIARITMNNTDKTQTPSGSPPSTDVSKVAPKDPASISHVAAPKPLTDEVKKALGDAKQAQSTPSP
jgi:hypothetical protein